MGILNPEQRRIAQAISDLVFCNPFLPERIAHEQIALGKASVQRTGTWNVRADTDGERPNVVIIQRLAEELLAQLHQRLAEGHKATPSECGLYRDLAEYCVYYRYQAQFLALAHAFEADDGGTEAAALFRAFRTDLIHHLDVPGIAADLSEEVLAHTFACSFQVRRAFHAIFRFIIGGSPATSQLRAAVWQSIFTHDMRRFRATLFDRMRDIAVLVTGASGTGKELVARAIARSQYVPFDPKRGHFAERPAQWLFPLNLSALSPALIESELFGHCRGAFTGAVADHSGWLEACGRYGTVFLDEIGEVEQPIQVKLLRVLESRSFSRLGETEPRTFAGKLIAATNRDLASEMQTGAFRADLYYRLCSDVIETPTLAAQLRDAPSELANLVRFIARRIVGDADPESLATDALSWISAHLGPGYAWPGNVRELEQCLRNILIRGHYCPPHPVVVDPAAKLLDDMRHGTLTAEELQRRYAGMVYAQCGSYEETGRRLGIDRRTVKRRVLAPDLAV